MNRKASDFPCVDTAHFWFLLYYSVNHTLQPLNVYGISLVCINIVGYLLYYLCCSASILDIIVIILFRTSFPIP